MDQMCVIGKLLLCCKLNVKLNIATYQMEPSYLPDQLNGLFDMFCTSLINLNNKL